MLRSIGECQYTFAIALNAIDPAHPDHRMPLTLIPKKLELDWTQLFQFVLVMEIMLDEISAGHAF